MMKLLKFPILHVPKINNKILALTIADMSNHNGFINSRYTLSRLLNYKLMAIEEEYRKRTTRVQEDEPFVESRVIADDGYRDTRYSVIYYLLNIIEALLVLRLVMKLLGANAGNGFVNGIYTITNPLVAPFAGIFPTPAVAGTVVEWSTIVAMIVYALIAYAIVQLIRVLTRNPRAV